MIKESLQKINWKLYSGLIVMGLCPAIYTTIRTFLLGQLPNEYAYSIAGQLTWVNLLYEVINETLILPLFFFMGSSISNKKEFRNKTITGLIIAVSFYTMLSLFIMLFAKPLLQFMCIDSKILTESIDYIRIESVANVFGIVFSFLSIVLISIGKSNFLYIATGIKMVLCLVFDVIFVSNLQFSFQLGVNGIAFSNIFVNLIMICTIVFLLMKEKFLYLGKDPISFSWCKNYLKTGCLSGLESFVRNIAYILMVSRMVNMVGEQGTYWVANNFIWGWLLLPVIALGELIKQEVSTDRNAVKTNIPGYLITTSAISFLWIITIPFYKPFLSHILGYKDVESLFSLIMVLLVFYIFYAFQNIFDSIFYGRGKIGYMLWESIVTNSVYYGTFFILYLMGIWTPNLIGIALMFGFGNLFDSIVSGIAYAVFLKQEHILQK